MSYPIANVPYDARFKLASEVADEKASKGKRKARSYVLKGLSPCNKQENIHVKHENGTFCVPLAESAVLE